MDTGETEQAFGSQFARLRCAKGPEYEDLLRVLAKLALRSARKRISDEAEREDVVQEILISVHEARFSYDKDKAFFPWFYAIVRYRIADWLRRNRRLSLFDEFRDELQELAPSVDRDDLADIASIVSELSEQQQRLLHFVKVEGYSILNAADKFGMYESAVKVAIHRTRNIIKQMLRQA